MIHFLADLIMNRKIIVIIGVVLLLVIGSGVGVYIYSSRKSVDDKEKTNSELIGMETPTPQPAADIAWDDPAGFTFKYSPTLSLNKHDEDEVNYAHLEFTESKHPGNILVWAKDTTAADVKAWVKTEKSFKDTNIIDTTLGGQPAKKVVLSGETKKIITGVIYDELLFTVEGTFTDNAYWTAEYQKIIDSFQFKPVNTAATTNTSTSASDDSGADEEETLE
jgi:hypothetical protein